MSQKTAYTAAYWNQHTTTHGIPGSYWLELASAQQRMTTKISGDATVDAVLYTIQRYFDGRLPLAQCLSLGCGEGRLERRMAQPGVFVDCDAMDIADQSLAAAQDAAQQAGYTHIHYQVADLNKIRLPALHYDAVWGTGAIHHIEQLEHLFGEVARALKPGGLFILDEYVGASRFQFPPRQREIIEACHALLPARYRTITEALTYNRAALGRDNWRWWVRRVTDKVRDGDLIGAVQRHTRRLWDHRRGRATVRKAVDLPTAQSVAAIDPSEAIRAAEIVPVLRQYFDIVEYKPMGGSILQFLLADIAGNFANEEGRKVLDMIFMIEDTLMSVGDLGSDFAYIVAAPKADQG